LSTLTANRFDPSNFSPEFDVGTGDCRNSHPCGHVIEEAAAAGTIGKSTMISMVEKARIDIVFNSMFNLVGRLRDKSNEGYNRCRQRMSINPASIRMGGCASSPAIYAKNARIFSAYARISSLLLRITFEAEHASNSF
jgi:hypothetical protein